MIRQRGTKYHYQFIKDGKRYDGVCEGCTTKRGAEAYEKNIRATVAKAVEQKSVKALVENFRDELTGGQSVTLTEAYDKYLTKPAKRTPGEHQIAVNRTYWADFTAFMAANFPDVTELANVTRQHAEAYISLLRQSGAFDKKIRYQRKESGLSYQSGFAKLSSRTCNARQQAIRAVFARLQEDAGIFANPFDVPKLNLDTESRDVFEEDEIQTICDNWTMPIIKPVFIIGFNTGLTLGDICLLKWSEIVGNWITNKKRRKTGTELEIPLLPPLAAFLNEQRSRTGSGEYVCPELAAMYESNPSGVFYRIKDFLQTLGIETTENVAGRSRAVSKKSAHAIRHTFAYQAGKHHVPLPIVQAILGHMTPVMTAMYERHAKREEKARYFQNMPSLTPVQEEQLPTATEKILSDPELVDRDKLKQLADTLPIEKIRQMLAIGLGK